MRIRNNRNRFLIENPLLFSLVCFSGHLLLSYLGHAHCARISLLADSFDLRSLLITFLDVALFSKALANERINSISMRNRFLLIHPSHCFDSCWRTDAKPSILYDQSSLQYFFVIKLDAWRFYFNSRWFRLIWGAVRYIPEVFDLARDTEWRINWNTSFVWSRARLHYFGDLHVTIHRMNFSRRL